MRLDEAIPSSKKRIISFQRGKNNHNFLNNEKKKDFFLFFVQKTYCAFAQFKYLLYFCTEITVCGRTQLMTIKKNCGLRTIYTRMSKTSREIEIILYNVRARKTPYPTKEKIWQKKSESKISPKGQVFL